EQFPARGAQGGSRGPPRAPRGTSVAAPGRGAAKATMKERAPRHSRLPFSRRFFSTHSHETIAIEPRTTGSFREREGGPGLRATFDADWRRRALAGNADAVTAFAEAVLQPLYGFCFYRVGRNRHLCEEVV